MSTDLPTRNLFGNSPLIVFIGPASCGKSMVLMSLVEYLRTHTDLVITPNYDYHSADPDYRKKCDNFIKTLEYNVSQGQGQYKEALDGTVDEVCLDVRKGGKNGLVKYRLLEANGEDFFSTENPETPYKPYLNDIISKTRLDKYPVYYVMMLDLYTEKNNFHKTGDVVRKQYESRLIQFYSNGFMPERGDKIILLLNKIDKAPFNKEEVLKNLMDVFYQKIPLHFKKHRFIFFTEQTYKTVLPYKTGEWISKEDHEGKVVWFYRTDADSEKYAKDLWDALTSRI